MIRSVLSLGSNSGTREWNILRGVALAASEPGIRVAALSPLYESEPEGEGYSGTFVNAAAAIETSLGPFDLLEVCMRIESDLGRARPTPVPDRGIDIDIVAYGDMVLDSPRLAIPHPRFRLRLFVLRPVSDILPGLKLPPDGASVEDLIRSVSKGGWVRRISSRRIVPSNFLNLKDLD